MRQFGWAAIFCASLAVAITAVADAPTLEETAAAAKRALAAVRPAASVADVRVEVFSSARARRALAKARERPDYFDVETILRTQLTLPVALGVLDQQEAASLVEDFSSRDVRMTDADGVAITSESVVLIRPGRVDSLLVVAHELAHVLSERLGYFTAKRQSAFPKTRNPKRVDLDALLMLWAIVEGDAEFTAKAVVEWQARGEAGLAKLWDSTFSRDLSDAGPSLSGPASITTPDGATVELKEGETYSFAPSSLDATLTHFVYKMSPRLVQLRRREGGTLEDAISSVWCDVPLHSKYLLAAAEERSPDLLELFNTREDDQASRLGAVLVWDFLVRKTQLAPHQASTLLGEFVDDLALRRGEAVAWITRWRTGASAEAFAKQVRPRGRTVKLARDRAGRSMVAWGDAGLTGSLLGAR